MLPARHISCACQGPAPGPRVCGPHEPQVGQVVVSDHLRGVEAEDEGIPGESVLLCFIDDASSEVSVLAVPAAIFQARYPVVVKARSERAFTASAHRSLQPS